MLDDYVDHSNNVYTSFLNTALNLWVGNEADYADASMLYNFILGSYFSARTMELAYKAEMNWSQDPENNQRFRLASILGGFSALERKSLAIIHDDQAAIEKIDNEHREWRLINPAFHSFTVGLSFFKEPENFLEGYMAWEGALSSCEERPELITCLNRPRYTFNSLGIFVGRADFALKSGDIASAQTYLFITQFLENFAFWDLGRDAITHRQINADAIAALYLNDDPSDDPSHFNMKKHKWGGDTSTCQTCHQTQSRVWSQEEQDNVLVAPDDMLTVGDWPEFSTTWYGALKTR